VECSHLAAGLQPAQRQRGEAEVPHEVLRRHHLHEQTTASSFSGCCGASVITAGLSHSLCYWWKQQLLFCDFLMTRISADCIRQPTLLNATKASVCSSHATGRHAAKRQPSAATTASWAAVARLRTMQQVFKQPASTVTESIQTAAHYNERHRPRLRMKGTSASDSSARLLTVVMPACGLPSARYVG
jgi:hypothetical protein